MYLLFLKTVSKYIILISNDNSLDWKEISTSEIQQRVLPKVKSGSIILFHNAAKHTPEALPGIIESLQKQGYKIVPISQLIYKDNYTINHEGRQIPSQAASSSQTAPPATTMQPQGLASV